jgi:hypothetical protein
MPLTLLLERWRSVWWRCSQMGRCELTGRPLLRPGVDPQPRGRGLGEIVIVLLAAKALAYAVFVCGFRGGPVFPAIFSASRSRCCSDCVRHVADACSRGRNGGRDDGDDPADPGLLIIAALLVGTAGRAIPVAALAAVAAWLTMAAIDARFRGSA